MDLLFYIFLFFHFGFLIVVVYNFITAPKIKNENRNIVGDPRISILIPARNEEENIGAVLNSVVSQSYSNLEIIVLDDHSEDNTASIVQKFANSDSRVRLVKGKELPAGWLGKNWACSQLAEAATSDLFLFIDADIQLDEHAIQNSLNLFQTNKLNMLSCFPTQKMESLGEKLVVPLMNWLLLTFLPLKFVYSSKNTSFSAANGQFILFDRFSYVNVGGHNAVKDQVVEDMELVRNIKKKNLKALTALGSSGVFCKMYNSFDDALKGFTKNFFAGFNTHPILFLLMIAFFLALFFAPFPLIIFDLNFIYISLLIIIQRILLSIISKQSSIWNALLHPLQIMIMFVVGIKSLIFFKSKRIEWKGRKII